MYKVVSYKLINSLHESVVEHFTLKEQIILNQVKAVLVANDLPINNAHNITLLLKGIPYVGDNFVADTLYYYERLKGLSEAYVARLYSPMLDYTQSQADNPYRYLNNRSARLRRVVSDLGNSYSILVLDGVLFVESIPLEDLILKVLKKKGVDVEEIKKKLIGPYDTEEGLAEYALAGKALLNKMKDRMVVFMPPELSRYRSEISEKLKGISNNIICQVSEQYSPSRPLLEEYIGNLKVASPKGFKRPTLIPRQMQRIWDDALYQMSLEKPLFDTDGNPNYKEALNYYYKLLTERLEALSDRMESDQMGFDKDIYQPSYRAVRPEPNEFF